MSRVPGSELPARWTRFAEKGGIGKCISMCDFVVASTEYLNFMKDDEITVLLQLPDREDLFLGFLDGRVGLFSGGNVHFLSRLKKPIMSIRVPTRFSDYSPSLKSAHTTDSESFSVNGDKFRKRGGAASPNQSIYSQSPYLNDRRRCPSIALSTVSTSSREGSFSIYEDYKNSRFCAAELSEARESATRGSGIRPWISSLIQSVPFEGDTPTSKEYSVHPATEAQSRMRGPQANSIHKSSFRGPDSTPQTEPSFLSDNSRPRAFFPNKHLSQLNNNQSPKPSPLRFNSWEAGSSSNPSTSSVHPPPVLHMPIPRTAPLLAEMNAAVGREHSRLQDRSFVTGDAFGHRIVVEDDNEHDQEHLNIAEISHGASSECWLSTSHGTIDAGHPGFHQKRTPLSNISINNEHISPLLNSRVTLSGSPRHTGPLMNSPLSNHSASSSPMPRLPSILGRLRPSTRNKTRLENQDFFSGSAHEQTDFGQSKLETARNPSSGKDASPGSIRRARSKMSAGARERYGSSSDSVDQENMSSPRRSASRSLTDRAFGIFTPPGRLCVETDVPREYMYLETDPISYVIKKKLRVRRKSHRVHSSSSSSSPCHPSRSDMEYSSVASS